MSVQSRIRIGIFCVLAGTTACRRPDAPPRQPDLLLITIDTLRADRLGRGLTPTLDALAARGVHFTNARAAAPLTLPSHVSMLTGAIPPTHGVRENGVDAFSGAPPTIARRLKDSGYRTAAFVGAYVLDRRFGLADGFDEYDDQIARDPSALQRLEAERPADQVVDRVLAWLQRVRPGSDRGQTGVRVNSDPWFLWVHFYDPHAPYTPPEEFLRRAGGTAYDGEVAFADAQAGRLIDAMRTAGMNPVIVVAGDHGESLGEHGERTHGMLAYDAALRVPLIVAAPDIKPARRSEPVSLIDVAPTVMALARSGRSDGFGIEGSSQPADPSGRNLLGPVPRDRETRGTSSRSARSSSYPWASSSPPSSGTARRCQSTSRKVLT